MMKSSDCFKKADCIVIKIGSALIWDGETVQNDWLASLAADIKVLVDAGKQIVLVTSGGVALGRAGLGVANDMPPGDIPLALKQAASAVGQYHMVHAYYTALADQGLKAAQVLLTMGETENRRMYLNARETLSTLMERGIIPVINENDTVSTGEIRFGDNDRLAVRVAQMINADAVVLLSTVDGLYTANPDIDAAAEHIPVIDVITDAHIEMAGEALPGFSTGGMQSKIQAAITAVKSGIALMIADGRNDGVLAALANDTARASVFAPVESNASARKNWIASHLQPKGRVFIDDGAVAALGKGGSLLPVGVQSVEGAFERGDVVTVHNASGDKIGIGVSSYSAEHSRNIAGKQSAEIEVILGYAGRAELIHRNDLALG